MITNKSRLRKILLLALLMMAIPSHGQLRITEIMQSNIDCLMDELNDFPDSWVELYNPDQGAAMLSDYSLGESSDPAKAWILPSTGLGPKGHYIVYCDNVGKGKHTDFRLDTDNNAHLYLFYKGVAVDSIVNLPKMPSPNVAYGRPDDDTDQWGYQLTATPGLTNKGISDIVLSDPVFNHEGCVYEKGTTLNITITPPKGSPEGTVVRYTTDGSEPTAQSKELVARESFAVKNSTVVKARLFCEGCVSRISMVQSYLFLDREMTMPVISISTDNRYLTDSKIGIYVDGTYDSSKKNYKYDWRRPIHFELFDQPGQPSILNQLCETRVSGAASRDRSLKSLAIYAHKRFGKKKFNYEFFPDQRPGQTNFKSLVLRNAGNDFDYLYLRDALSQRVMAEHADIDWQAWRPAIVFINGTYKGILNVRERGNEHNIYTNHDGLEDVDVVENWGSLKEGTWENLNAFKAFYKESGHTWDECEQWMECDEFINLMIMNCYFCNIDFPGNNIVMWRPRTDEGRWRWIAKDVDYGMGIYEQRATAADFRYLDWLYNTSYDSSANWGNNSDATRLFRRLMDDDTFKRRFIDRYTIYMNTFLNYDSIWAVWEPMYDMIKEEYPVHRKLYNEWWPNYGNEMQKVKTWLRQRNSNVILNLRERYALGTETPLNINTSLSEVDLEGVRVTFNEVPLVDNQYSGTWYTGRQVSLTSTSTDGYHCIVGWEVAITTNGRTEQQTYNGSTLAFNPPLCQKVEVTAIVDVDADALPTLASHEVAKRGTLYDLAGRRMTQQPRPHQIAVDAEGRKFRIDK